jgi:hypothetical protein
MLSTGGPADAPARAAALVEFDRAVQALVEQDPDRHGRFSRAYVTAIFRACLVPPEQGSGVPRGRPDPEIAQALKQWIPDPVAAPSGRRRRPSPHRRTPRRARLLAAVHGLPRRR